MLDMAIVQLSENTICSNCKIFRNRDHRCRDEDSCRSSLFDGLQAKAEKAIGEKLYYNPDADDDKMPEDEMFDPSAMNEMYAEQI